MRRSTSAVIGALLATTALSGTVEKPPLPDQPVSPAEVLVLFNATWPDEDGNRRSDSEDMAAYYAMRRAIPTAHLLGLTITPGGGTPDHLEYRDFFERVLVPTRTRLAELTAAGASIHYIVTCYGMPLVIATHLDGKQGEHPIWKPSHHDASTRSLTGWLVNLEENFQAGVDARSGKPGLRGGPNAVRGGPPLGSVTPDIALAGMHERFHRPDQMQSFKAVRAQARSNQRVYLVTHLGGSTLETSQNLVDQARYAERYLQNFSGEPEHPYYGRVWLDHHPGRDAGHRSSLLIAARWFQGLLPLSVYAPANATEQWFRGPPWDVRIDNAIAEIGSKIGNTSESLHAATATGVIESLDTAGRVITLARAGPVADPAPASYFAAGETVASSSGRRARVESVVSERALKLSSIEGFHPHDTVTWRQESPFPLKDVVFYYGYYGLGKYQDVYQFRVGAIGSHMDSDSIVWAQAAIRRGITATAGAINEPSAAGLPRMGEFFAALTSGHDVAESFYSSIPYNVRWNTVIFGDPLYAPFRIRVKERDQTAPVIRMLTLRPFRTPGGGRRVLLTAELGGARPEEHDDIAVWQVEYGPSPEYGHLIPYIEWPEPGNSSFSERRRYAYSRRFTYDIIDLRPGTTYHFRVSARDPSGNVATATGTVAVN